MSSSIVDTSSGERLTGRVKWFNNKTGYGFITITDGDKSGSDIFVHHSHIVVSNQQYKYLVQGEYVEFSLIPTQNNTHEFQAFKVSGIRDGILMCETRNNNFRNTRPIHTSQNTENVGGSEWTVVDKGPPVVQPTIGKEQVKQPLKRGPRSKKV